MLGRGMVNHKPRYTPWNSPSETRAPFFDGGVMQRNIGDGTLGKWGFNQEKRVVHPQNDGDLTKRNG